MLEGPGCGGPDPIIPDGRAEIIFHYGAPFEHHREDGRVDRQPSAIIVGQLTAPMYIAHRGNAGVAAVRLRPAAVPSVARVDADELTGRYFPLDDVVARTGSLHERLALASSDVERVALLDAWVASVVRETPCARLQASTDLIDRRRGAVEIPAVARQAGLSARQLERSFLAAVGLTPKAFARLARLQHALRRVSAGEPLAAVAHACGYYDQSHMTRDFSRLAQTSPAAWRSTGGTLTPLFVAR
jgi:AraC-like DNA-binding protein